MAESRRTGPLSERDAVLGGRDAVQESVRQHLASGGRANEVNALLADGYAGQPAACNALMEALQSFEALLHTPPTDLTALINDVLQQALRTAFSCPEKLAGLDAAFLRWARPPKWVDPTTAYPATAEVLCELRFAHWASPFLRFALLKIKRCCGRAQPPPFSPSVHAAVAASFHDVLDRVILSVVAASVSRDDPTLQSRTDILTRACRISYAATHYATSKLSAIASGAAPDPRLSPQKARAVLHALQSALLPERGALHVSAMFPLDPPAVKAALESSASLFAADAEKIRSNGAAGSGSEDGEESCDGEGGGGGGPARKRARLAAPGSAAPWQAEVSCNTVLLSLVCQKVGREAAEGSAAGGWVELLQDVGDHLQQCAEAAGGGGGAGDGVPHTPYVVDAVRHLAELAQYADEQHAGDLVVANLLRLRSTAASCGVAACVTLAGYLRLLEHVITLASEESLQGVVRSLLRGVLDICTVRRALAEHEMVRTAVWALVQQGSEEDMPQHLLLDCCAAYWVLAAAAPSPIAYLALVRDAAVKDVPRVDRRVLHLSLALCQGHFRPPYSPVLGVLLRGIAESPAAKESLRTASPPAAGYLPRPCTEPLKAWLKQHFQVESP